MRRIAIIGGGIVGVSAAYYLSKEDNIEVTLFDDGQQTTKAAVGIICPWLNQRRNMFWYDLVRDGAEFYDRLMDDLSDNSFYQNIGALYINPKMEDKMFDIATRRSKESYKVGKVSRVSKELSPELSPLGFKWDTGIYVSGAARVDGKVFLEVLMEASLKQGLIYHNKKVDILESKESYSVEGRDYDALILSPGPYLKDLMKFKSEYHIDLRAQKGQLITFERKNKKEYPVIMPKGEIDFLFGRDGQLVVGASHENEYKDKEVDWEILNHLKEEAIKYYPELEDESISSYRVGFRAHNSSYTPFYGNLREDPNIYVASALGSSGLTSGPIIGYRLAQVVINVDSEISNSFNANDYVYKKEKPM